LLFAPLAQSRLTERRGRRSFCPAQRGVSRCCPLWGLLPWTAHQV